MSQISNAASAQAEAARHRTANQRIFRAFLSISSAALLIRVMGMLNQVIVTSHFGLGAAMDAYFVASGLPLLIASLITGSLDVSVVPGYTRVRDHATREQMTIFFSTLLNLFLIGAALLTVVMFVFRRQLIFIVAPGLDPGTMQLAVNLTPFIIPAFLFLVAIGYLESILAAEGQFGWPAYAGVLVPFTTAVLVLVIGRSEGVIILCIGMLVGLCFQISVVVVRVRSTTIAYRPIIDLHNAEIAAVLALAWPALVSGLILQASPLVDQMFASTLSAGSISALNYSLKLISVPVGVIFAAAGRAVLPFLSRQIAAGDVRAFKETLRLNLWVVGGVTAVLSALMFVFAHLIVQILFQRGAFTPADTTHTASTLRGFTVGLIPMALGFMLARTFSAVRKTYVLTLTSLFAILANALFDFIFARLWQSVGIALSTSAVYYCTMIILLILLRREVGNLDLLRPPPELLVGLRQMGGARFRQCQTWIARFTMNIPRRFGVELHDLPWVASREERLPGIGIPPQLRQPLLYSVALLAILAAGVGSVFMDPVLVLRIVLGVPFILILLRFPYVLLLVWASIEVFFGSAVPFLSGNNVQTALTVPTLLLLVTVPFWETVRRIPALAFMLLFLLWSLISIGVSSIDPVTFLKEWTLTLDVVALAVLSVNILTTRRRLLGVTDTILALSAGLALFGIYGYVTHRYGQLDTQAGVFRASSIFGVATGFSFFLSLVIPLALYRLFTVRGLLWRAGLSALILVFLLALGLTFTRAALATVPLCLIILGLFLPSRRMKVSVLCGTLGVGILLVLLEVLGYVHVFDRFFNQDLATLNGRTYLWAAVLDHFDPTQIFGHGLGASDALLTALHIGANGLTSISLIGTSPHSLFLGTLYDHGIIGLLLLTLALTALLVSLVKGAKKASGEHRLLYSIALAVCISTIIQSIDSNQIMEPLLGTYFWIIVTLPFARYWSYPKPPSETEQPLVGTNVGPSPESRQQRVSQPLR